MLLFSAKASSKVFPQPSEKLAYGQGSVSQLPSLPGSILVLNIGIGISLKNLGNEERNCYYKLQASDWKEKFSEKKTKIKLSQS